MTKTYRYSQLEKATGVGFNEVSIDILMPELKKDKEGKVTAAKLPLIKLTLAESLRLLQPYAQVRLMEQVKAVVPLALYLALFQILILRQVVDDSWLVTGGLFAVIIGLMFFMEGLKLGLMPFGTAIGQTLPKKSPLPLVLFITFLLGIGVTFAEPAIGALKAAGQNVSVEHAPYLFALLNIYTDQLVLVVGISVGAAAVLGTLRFIYGWSLKPLIYSSLLPVLGLSLYVATQPELVKVLGLAWDAGAVTTGPVTVPLVLALGIGIAASVGKGGSQLSGFGIVTMASLFPIAGVLLLLLYVAWSVSPEQIIESAKALAAATQSAPAAWYARSPGEEVVMGIRAILPLVLFLFFVYKVILRETLQKKAEVYLGIFLTILGMSIFNLGLTYGLSKLGGSAGGLVPIAFMQIDGYTDSPLYIYLVGLILALAFAWFLGYGATVAEPALNALGITTEKMTHGVFTKRSLIFAVSMGVAFGIALGLAKLIFDLPLIWLIVPGYLIAAILTYFSSEEFVNVAWDSAGVTTGPITVPLVLALGLGFGDATGAVEGFGILSMASIGPIITVMISGLWSRYRAESQARAAMRKETLSNSQKVEIGI